MFDDDGDDPMSGDEWKYGTPFEFDNEVDRAEKEQQGQAGVDIVQTLMVTTQSGAVHAIEAHHFNGVVRRIAHPEQYPRHRRVRSVTIRMTDGREAVYRDPTDLFQVYLFIPGPRAPTVADFTNDPGVYSSACSRVLWHRSGVVGLTSLC